MLFAQTNYHQELLETQAIQFYNLSPTVFLREYILTISPETVSENHLDDLHDLIYQKYDSNKLKDISDNKLIDAIVKSSKILYMGIHLFDWKYYRHNFLNNTNKLQAYPLIEESNANDLGYRIGLSPYITDNELSSLSVSLGFEDISILCDRLSKEFILGKRSICLILYYACKHFPAIKS
jgi:hypothetical protein